MPVARPKPEDYADRDRAMLAFIARYRVGLYESMARVFMENKPVGHVQRRLEAKGWVTIHQRQIPGGLSYSTLTAAGKKKIGIEPADTKPLSGMALDLAFAIAWYCTLEKHRWRRMTPQEVVSQYGKAAPRNVPHVIADQAGVAVISRVHLSLGKLSSAVKKVESLFDALTSKRAMRSIVKSGDYGLLVLAPTAEKTDQLKELFQAKKLHALGRVSVALGPTTETLARCLKRRN